jgi:hypothetical protein
MAVLEPLVKEEEEEEEEEPTPWAAAQAAAAAPEARVQPAEAGRAAFP